MRIGELAVKAGVNIQTVRFYERKSLLRLAERTPSGYRRYYGVDLQQILFIKRSQQLGFTLKEIKQLMPLHDLVSGNVKGPYSHDKNWKEIVVVAREKLTRIEDKLKLVKRMHKELSSMIRRLEFPHADVCPAAEPSRSSRR